MEELARRLEALLDELADDRPEVRALYRRAMECELAFFDAMI
jgi:thiaminase/transcriptional activator TenA